MTIAAFALTMDGLAQNVAWDLATRLEEATPTPLAVTINETDEARQHWNVVALYKDEAQAKTAVSCLALALSGPHAAVISPVIERDWVRESLLGLAPVKAGRFQLHGSHDRDKRQAGGIVLEIDAGTAFGTGHHGTTEGCLLALEHIVKAGRPRRILDVGTGTGVLALAAASLLKRQVVASDIDPEAVRVTRRNASVNHLGPLVRTITASGLKHPALANRGRYDLIFANILARPLVALAADILSRLAPGGVLVLSGLTTDQERLVGAAYRNRGARLWFTLHRAPWSVLVFRGS